jgi:CMP/dCMP kinase
MVYQEKPQPKMINIAIDGFSGCGKSTLARDLAKNLGFRFVDSGALYRAMTYLVIRSEGSLFERIERVVHSKPNLTFTIGSNRMLINGKDCESDIRGAEVANNVSEIAKDSKIRDYLKGIQADMIRNKGVVMEGRDIASVIMPKAELKLFITASVTARVDRRYRQLLEGNEKLSKEEIQLNLMTRDEQDINRKTAPLCLVDKAIVIDTTYLSRSEQLKFVLALVNPILKPQELLPLIVKS